MAEKKTRWEKLDIVFKLVGALLPAFVITIFGFLGRSYLVDRETREANSRLYTELTSNRERADSELRSAMFNTIITTFLNPRNSEPSESKIVLAIELLAYNFHDVIDLSPLFQQVSEQISRPALAEDVDTCLQSTDTSECLGDEAVNNCVGRTDDILACLVSQITPILQGSERALIVHRDSERAILRGRLERVAQEVVRNQIAALAESATLETFNVYFDSLDAQNAKNWPKRLPHEYWLDYVEEAKEGFKIGHVSNKLDVGDGLHWTGLVDGITDSGSKGTLRISELIGNVKHNDSIYSTQDGTLRGRVNGKPRNVVEDLPVRSFSAKVLSHDEEAREVEIRLLIDFPLENGGGNEVDEIFSVGFFDFPMINNTRLSNGQRCAVVLMRMSDVHAQLGLVYFPGSRAGLKERLYYDEVVENLQTQRTLDSQ